MRTIALGHTYSHAVTKKLKALVLMFIRLFLLVWCLSSTMNLCISCTASNDRVNVCEIVGCFSCEQVQVEITPMLQSFQIDCVQVPQKL